MTDHISEKDMMKLRAILARAEQSPFENEREVAWEAATRLMAKLSINLEDLDDMDISKSKDNVVKYNVVMHAPYGRERLALLNLIGKVFSCVTVEIAGGKHPDGLPGYIYGFQQDVDMAWTLFESLLTQMLSDLDKEGRQSVRYKKSFIYEFAFRVSERIREFYFQSVQDEHGSKGELVLANRYKTVEDYVNANENVQTVNRNRKVDPFGALAGREAGNRANISMGHRNLDPDQQKALS